MSKTHPKPPRFTIESPLPNDSILDVLSRLPTKTLLQFKCVSKSWNDSISDPNFIKMHLNKAIQDNRMDLFLTSNATVPRGICLVLLTHFYCLEGNSFNVSAQIENPLDYRVAVLGTCNGIVCVCHAKYVCLLNPCTREYKIVEFPRSLDFYERFYGVGYDEGNDEYIIVQVCHIYVRSHQYSDSEVSLYSLNDSSCLKLSDIPYRISSGEPVGISVNGCIYWLAKSPFCLQLTVICYVVEKRVFKEIHQRPGGFHRDDDISLSLFRGQLCMLDNGYNDTEAELWVMGNSGGVDLWIKLFSIEKEFVPRVPGFRLLCFYENGKIQFYQNSCKLPKYNLELIIYDPKTKQVANIGYAGLYWKNRSRIIGHVASLVKLKSGTYLGDVTGA